MYIESGFKCEDGKIKEATIIDNELLITGTMESTTKFLFVISRTCSSKECENFEKYFKEKITEKFDIKIENSKFFHLPMEKITEYFIFMYDTHEKYNEEVLNVKK